MRNVLSTLAFLSVCPLVLTAQVYRGAVSGVVTDPSGAAVTSASIILIEIATGTQHTTQSTSAGLYDFQALPVGGYELKLSVPGFNPVTVTNVIVEAGRDTSLPLHLAAVQGAAETITVKAADLTLDTADNAETTVLSSKVMNDVPLNGRDFTQLLKLVPGYANSGNLAGTLNGGRTNTIDWQIDGVDNNDLWFNTYSVNQGGEAGIAATLLPIDAIEELSIQSQSGVDGGGRTSGGTANAILKSGTNRIHGDAYYFNRNEALALANWFDPSQVPVIRDQEFGGTVGGPIQRDKTFYFLAYEQQKLTVGHSIQGTVPSAAWATLGDSLLAANNISANPVSAKLLTYYSGPGVSSAPATINNYLTTAPDQDTSYNGLIKLDHTFQDQSNLSLRWFGGTGKQVAYDRSALTNFYQRVPSRMNNAAAVYNRTFGPRLTSQTLFGINFYLQGYYDVDTAFHPVQDGLDTGVTDPTLAGAPTLSVEGFTQIGATNPSRRYQYTGHFTETLTYLTGRHTLRFGGEYRHAVVNVAYHSGQKGSFNFTGNEGPHLQQISTSDAWNAQGFLTKQGYSASSASVIAYPLDGLADFLAGYVGAGQAGIVDGDVQRRFLINAIDGYAGDVWKATPTVSLDYGLYWNYTSPPNDPTDRISTFIPSRGGFVFTGHGIDTIYPRDFHDLAPRFGLSWNPSQLKKMVLRGGFGLYYQTPNDNYFANNHPKDNNNSFGVQYNPFLYAVPGSPNTNVVSYSNPSAFAITANQPIFIGSGNVALGGFSIAQNFITGYSESYNANMQYQLTNSTVLELGYVGSEAHRLPATLEINQIPAGGNHDAQGNPTPGVNNNAARPYYNQFPQLQGIDQVESVSNQSYTSFIASLRTTNWHNLTASINYTLGHGMDDISTGRSAIPENSYNLKGDWGNSDLDVRHTFGAFVNYSIPSPESHKRLLGGWQVNSWITGFTGNPFTVTTPVDVSLTGQFRDRPNVVGDPTRVTGVDLVNRTVTWFNPYKCGQTNGSGNVVTTNCFADNTVYGTYGKEKRNQFYGPGLSEVDLSVFKNTPITERIRSQFRVEIYNLFDKRNLSGPDTGLGDGPGSLGHITSTFNSGNAPGVGLGEPFNVQLALKLLF